MPYKNKEKARASWKAYREAHKENRKNYDIAYGKLNKEKIKNHHKSYYEANKEKIKVSMKVHRQNNKEEYRARKKTYYEVHKEEAKASMKTYAQSNPDKIRAIQNRRRAKKADAISLPIREDFRDRLIETWDNKCAYCKNTSDKWELDHYMPLELKGHDAEYNLVLACPYCNRSKGYKHPDVWLKEKGYSFTKPDYMLDTNHKPIYSLTMSNTTCSCNLDPLEKPFYKLLVDTDEGIVEMCEEDVKKNSF